MEIKYVVLQKYTINVMQKMACPEITLQVAFSLNHFFLKLTKKD